jgi:hypothetical protein
MPLSCAGRAAKVARLVGPDRSGLALVPESLGDRRAGKGRVMAGEQAAPGSRQGTRAPRGATGHDVGIELLKGRVPGALTVRMATQSGREGGIRRVLNYRRAEGGIIINQDCRGWWDPQNEARSDAKYRRPIEGILLPTWEALEDLVRCAAPLSPGLRTPA